MAEQVVTPDGQTWVVRRRWDPKKRRHGPRLRRQRSWFSTNERRTTRTDEDDKRLRGLDVADGCFDLDGLVVVILVAAAVILLWFVIIPVLVLLGELVLLLAVVVGAIVGRVLFRRPWVIEAAGPMDEVHHWEVVGWRASGDHARLVAQQLRDGLPLPS
jgi:hypothetical protein